MKVDFKTSKLYYGFPVLLIGYKDEKWRYNVTTSSSSYSLGNMLTIGIKKESNCAKQILKYRQFTVNIPSKEMIRQVELCGFHPSMNKIGLADLTYDPGVYVDAPVLDDCLLSLECEVDHAVTEGGYVNFIATIKRRAIEENLLDEQGNFKSTDFNPIYFLGDGSGRIFRYLHEPDVSALGQNSDCCNNDDNSCG